MVAGQLVARAQQWRADLRQNCCCWLRMSRALQSKSETENSGDHRHQNENLFVGLVSKLKGFMCSRAPTSTRIFIHTVLNINLLQWSVPKRFTGGCAHIGARTLNQAGRQPVCGCSTCCPGSTVAGGPAAELLLLLLLLDELSTAKRRQMEKHKNVEISIVITKSKHLCSKATLHRHTRKT